MIIWEVDTAKIKENIDDLNKIEEGYSSKKK